MIICLNHIIITVCIRLVIIECILGYYFVSMPININRVAWHFCTACSLNYIPKDESRKGFINVVNVIMFCWVIITIFRSISVWVLTHSHLETQQAMFCSWFSNDPLHQYFLFPVQDLLFALQVLPLLCHAPHMKVTHYSPPVRAAAAVPPDRPAPATATAQPTCARENPRSRLRGEFLRQLVNK